MRVWCATLVGLGLGAGCDGGGGGSATDAAVAFDASSTDAVLDASDLDAAAPDADVPDAAALDASVDAVPTDAPYVADASPCGIAPSAAPITSPQSQTPWVPTGWGLSAVSVFSLTVPMALESLSYEMTSYAAVMTVRAMCNGPVLSAGVARSQIVDGTPIEWTSGTASALAAGTYLIETYVSFPNHPSAFLDVRGVIASGEACTGPLVSAGVLACSTRARCLGGVCVPVACSNGVDDDGDGLADDADPGCATADDPDEQDTCGSGGACAQCADTVDSDGDGLAGWPEDLGCERRGDAAEHNCPDADGVVEVTTSTSYPLPLTSASDHPAVAHCHGGGADRTFHLSIPGDLSQLRVVVGQQAIDLALYRDVCHGPPDRCQPGAPGQTASALGAVVAGDYWLVAKPFSSGASISISGQHIAGARCVPSMPVFQCPTPQACLPDGAGGHQCQ